MSWQEFFQPLNPGWFLQWGAERALHENPGCNILVVDGQGFPLCGIVSPNATKRITLVADNGMIYPPNNNKHIPSQRHTNQGALNTP